MVCQIFVVCQMRNTRLTDSQISLKTLHFQFHESRIGGRKNECNSPKIVQCWPQSAFCYACQGFAPIQTVFFRANLKVSFVLWQKVEALHYWNMQKNCRNGFCAPIPCLTIDRDEKALHILWV